MSRDRKSRAEQMRQTVGEAVDAAYAKTSGRFHDRGLRVHRSRLTGVSEETDLQGWVNAVARPHMCLPPEQYPEDCGEGSRWFCRCGALWQAEGLMMISEYPSSPTRTEVRYGPLRWRWVEGGQLPEEDYRAQEDHYDWRPLGPYFVQLARMIIDNQLVAGGWSGLNGPQDWRNLP